MKMQRYIDKKIRVCDKNSIPLLRLVNVAAVPFTVFPKL